MEFVKNAHKDQSRIALRLRLQQNDAAPCGTGLATLQLDEHRY
jgi:hypothetical protein